MAYTSSFEVPLSNYPSGSGNGGSAEAKFSVSQIYNAANNTSALTIKLYMRQGESSYRRLYALQAGSITVSSGSASVSTTFASDYTVDTRYSTDWVPVQKDGADATWSLTVPHAANGSATVSFRINGINLYFYSGLALNVRFGDTTNTYSFSAFRYTLSASAGTGSGITVNRQSSVYGGTGNLSNGAVVYTGDVLKVTFSVSTGYSLGTHTVNGTTFASGGTTTVNGNVTVVATANVLSYKLTINAGTGSTITVTRTSSPKKGAATGVLSNNADVYYSDVLTISAAAQTGYNLTALRVNNSPFTSGNSHTVTGAVAVATTAALKTYTLTISAGTGSTITVKRGNTTLSNGATISHFDNLVITFGASTGYNLGDHKVNGSTFTSGNTYQVVGATTVSSTASLKTYTLSVSADAHSSVVVKRGSTTITPGANAVTHGDVLTITVSTDSGYAVKTFTVNGAAAVSPATHTVSGNVAVVTTSSAVGFAYIYVGSSYTPYSIFIYNGSSWERYRAYVWNGSSWVMH